MPVMMPPLMSKPLHPLPSSVPPQVPTHVRLTQVAAVSTLALLIVLALAWEMWLAPLRPGGSWLALKALPLALPLSGLLRNRMYTYRWTALFVWLYVTEGIVRASGDDPPGDTLALLQVVLCVLLFTACTLHIRLRLKQARTAPASSHPPEN